MKTSGGNKEKAVSGLKGTEERYRGSGNRIKIQSSGG